ncbi:MAG TPA: hypothetical protein VEI96_10180, partial [Thermodesulfovibrionales bacterium]|nr:hypothetical protein [Thermodesulfovibrionales bacterium]
DLLDWGDDVGNVLKGSNYLVNLSTLETFAYNATALGDFSNRAFTDQPQAATPNLASGTDGLNGLNYALTKQNFYSVYDIESPFRGKSEAVVTFPTKNLTHVPNITWDSSGQTCIDSKKDIFADPRLYLAFFDDAGHIVSHYCPWECTGCEPAFALPHGVNLVCVNDGPIFISDVATPVIPASPFSFGFLNFDMVHANCFGPVPTIPTHATTVSTNNHTFTSAGLPAIGYVALSFVDGGSSHMLPMQYDSNVTITTSTP